MMKTYSAKPNEIERDWFVVDASDKVLGRLAAGIAHRLRGKHKPEFTRHIDTGDFIVVVNADKLRVTGNKAKDKLYHRHQGSDHLAVGTRFDPRREGAARRKCIPSWVARDASFAPTFQALWEEEEPCVNAYEELERLKSANPIEKARAIFALKSDAAAIKEDPANALAEAKALKGDVKEKPLSYLWGLFGILSGLLHRKADQ